MKILALQTNILWENPPGNLRRITEMVDAARPEPGTLIILPEMATTGFTNNLDSCRGFYESTLKDLTALVQKHQCGMVASIARIDHEGPGRNQAMLIRPNGAVGPVYTKLFPFSMGGEPATYPAGQELVCFEWAGLRVAPFICYDLRFPEIFRVATVQGGAEVLIVVASWPIKRVQHWVTLLQARAIENLAYVVGVNRCGTDPNFTYPGRTLVVDPHGVIIADASDAETVLPAMLDPERVRSWRKDFPPLKDVRPEWLPAGHTIRMG